MSGLANRGKIEALIDGLGRAAPGAGRIYLVGGATAVLCGWRSTTLDVDTKLHLEPDGVFAAIEQLKHELLVNIELAALDQFVPALPGWEERSVFIRRSGQVDFYHYDFYSQTLAKLERGHDRDLRDVEEMAARKLVDRNRLRELFESVRGDFPRYPAVDVQAVREAVDAFAKGVA